MSEIINYINVIIFYIMDIFYIITTVYVIIIGFWVTLWILFSIIKWIINSKYKYIFINTIYFILLCISFILMLILSAVECCEDPCDYTVNNSIDNIMYYLEYDMLNEYYPSNYSPNIIYCMADEGWERYFPTTEKDYTNLSIADKNEVNKVFTRNVPGFENQILTKDEVQDTFKESTSKHSWDKLDRALYNKRVVLNAKNFENLYKGVISVKLANLDLNLNWRNLCYLYNISHHSNLPFDIHNIKSYTPESFYENLESNKDYLNSYWKNEYSKYQNTQNELYAYMRIIDSVVNKRH